MSRRKEELPVLTKAHDLALRVLPMVERMPRQHKFTLGDRIATLVYSILEKLVDARYTRQRAPILTDINLRLEKLRIMLRLASELRTMSIKSYGAASALADDVGAMVGGWLRSAAQ